jgi:hypothetical protein
MTIDIMEDVGLVATHPTMEFFIHPSVKLVNFNPFLGTPPCGNCR